MQAAVYYGQGDIRVEDVDDPICESPDIVLRVAACGVCGTDVSAYVHGSMLTSPGQVMGHEFSGRIVEVGSDVRELEVGERVTAWPAVRCDRCPRCAEGSWNLCEGAWGYSISSGLPGAFAEYVRVPRARIDRTVYRLPDNVSWVAGAMVEPLSVAQAAGRLVPLRPTDTVVVMGLGMIGLGVVQTLRMSGVTGVIGVDRSEIRLTQARELGAETVIDATGTDVADGVRATAGVGPLSSARVDTVFECSGAPAALSQAVEILRPGGHLVLVALYGETPHVDLNSVIAKQIEVHGAWAYRTEFVTTLELLGSDRLVADRLVTQTFPVAQTVEAFRAQMDPEKSVKVMVAPSDII